MKNKKVLLVLAAMIVTLSLVGGVYWLKNMSYIATEDARIDGSLVKVYPQIAGKILELNFVENQPVRANEIIGVLSDITLPVGSDPDLAVIRVPIDGVIIKKIGNEGEMASTLSPIAMVADLNHLYVTANIEEDKLSRVQVGQSVDITVDAFNGVKLSGKVDEIGSAATSVFSLLPAQNSNSSFVKVTQRIPVKISCAYTEQLKLLPGMNARVVIHIRQGH